MYEIPTGFPENTWFHHTDIKSEDTFPEGTYSLSIQQIFCEIPDYFSYFLPYLQHSVFSEFHNHFFQLYQGLPVISPHMNWNCVLFPADSGHRTHRPASSDLEFTIKNFPPLLTVNTFSLASCFNACTTGVLLMEHSIAISAGSILSPAWYLPVYRSSMNLSCMVSSKRFF